MLKSLSLLDLTDVFILMVVNVYLLNYPYTNIKSYIDFSFVSG